VLLEGLYFQFHDRGYILDIINLLYGSPYFVTQDSTDRPGSKAAVLEPGAACPAAGIQPYAKGSSMIAMGFLGMGQINGGKLARSYQAHQLVNQLR